MYKLILFIIVPMVMLLGNEESNRYQEVWDAYGVTRNQSYYEKQGINSVQALILKERAPNISIELAIRLLKVFDAKQAYEVYLRLPHIQFPALMGEDYFKPIIKLTRLGFALEDAVTWYTVIKPEHDSTHYAMLEYYKNGFKCYVAKDYIFYQFPVKKALLFEAKANKECPKNWEDGFGIGGNPYDLKGRCFRTRQVEQKILIDKNTGIYKYGNTWLKIVDKNGPAKTLFTGIIRFQEPEKFTEPNGYTTMIPSAKSVATFSWY